MCKQDALDFLTTLTVKNFMNIWIILYICKLLQTSINHPPKVVTDSVQVFPTNFLIQLVPNTKRASNYKLNIYHIHHVDI